MNKSFKLYISAICMLMLFAQCSKKGAEVVSTNTQVIDKTWRKMAPAPAPARDISIGEYTAFDLENGLKVIVVENHKLPRVSYQLSLDNEALIEGDKAGYTSFAGDLLSKGTTSMTKAEIDEKIDFLGASLNTSATGIFASSLKKHSESLLGVMSDVLYNPSFPKDEFEKIRKRTASNLASSKTNPEAIAGNIKNIVNYGKGHPYGEVQTEETIKNITVEDCKNYYRTYFKPNNAYLVIVGDITPAEAKTQATKYFSAWKRADVPKMTYAEPKGPKGSQVAFGNKDGAVQSVINISYPVDMKPGSADAIKANVMNSILGGGIFSGRLMQNLREKKAYTYGARSSLSNDRLIGNFNAFASVRNEVTDSAVTQFMVELNRIVNEPVSQEDLNLAKSSLNGNFGRSLESPQTIANFALNTFRYNLPKDYYNNYLKNLDAVTIADVQMMAKKYIRPDNCNIIVVGNKDNVADKLKVFDSDGVIDFYGPFGEKLDQNTIQVPADATGKSVLEDYLKSLGGIEKLKAVQSMFMAMKASLMGQEATFETYQLIPNKYAMKVSMMGMTVQEQKFDGTKGMRGQMGQNKVITEGKEFDELKMSATIFEQIDYLKPGNVVELKGAENIDGKPCYKILVTRYNGDQVTEYYDFKTNLLVRSVKSEGEGEEAVSITTDYAEYKVVEGVLIPHKITLSGAMPQPIVMEATAVEINKPVKGDVFKID